MVQGIVEGIFWRLDRGSERRISRSVSPRIVERIAERIVLSNVESRDQRIRAAERSGREQRGSLRESRQADTSGRELLREARAESALESSRESVQSDHTDHPGAALQPILLSADSSWSAKLRDGEAPDDLGRTLDFQTILSEFDADHDGWAELLVYTVIPSNGGISANLTLNLYTDPGLAPLKATFHRDLSSPESCLDP